MGNQDIFLFIFTLAFVVSAYKNTEISYAYNTIEPSIPPPQDEPKTITKTGFNVYQKTYPILLDIYGSNSEAQFKFHLGKLEQITELQNPAFSVKGGAAITGDDLYILTNTPFNKILDTHKDHEWTGKSRDEFEIMFFDKNRTRIAPSSNPNLIGLWIFVFAKNRVYYINYESNLYGYYQRKIQ